MKYIGFLMLCIISHSGELHAFEYEEPLQDTNLEQRAQDLFLNIRCITCVSQAISDSDADLAKDLRLLIRNKLKNGESDEQIKQFLVDRYGDQVLLSPPVEKTTYILWLTPWFLVIIGILVLTILVRKKHTKK